MEKDLAKVQDMMAGLTEQQAELSEAMKRFRRLSSGGGLENMLDKPEKGRRSNSYIGNISWATKYNLIIKGIFV